MFDTLDGRLCRAVTDIEEDRVGRQLACLAVVQAHFERLGTGKVGFTHQEVEACGAFDAPLAAVAKAVHNVALALPHLDHINRDRAGMDTIISTSPSEIGYPRAGNHGLGGGTAHVDASASNMFPLDEGGLPSRFC